MSAKAARTLVAQQRIRNRIFVVVAATAAMLDAGIVVFLAAVSTRMVVGVAVAGVLVAASAAITRRAYSWKG